mgnify:CR=1 FL=1
MPDYIVEMKVSMLKPNPINETIYDNNEKALTDLNTALNPMGC